MLVRSCFLITLIKCLKGHKSLGLLFYVNKEKWQEKYNLETLIFIIVLNSRCLCGGSLKLSYLVKTWNLEASKLQIRDLRHCLWALFWEFKLFVSIILRIQIGEVFCGASLLRQEEIAFKIPRHGIAGGHSRQCGDTKLKEFDVYTIQK